MAISSDTRRACEPDRTRSRAAGHTIDQGTRPHGQAGSGHPRRAVGERCGDPGSRGARWVATDATRPLKPEWIRARLEDWRPRQIHHDNFLHAYFCGCTSAASPWPTLRSSRISSLPCRIDPAPYRAVDAAWPLSAVFMVVVGIAVARAGALGSWRRFAPVFCGAALPLSVITAAVAGRAAMGPAFGVTTTLAWGATSWALMGPTEVLAA
jgi:hypothetical protein